MPTHDLIPFPTVYTTIQSNLNKTSLTQHDHEVPQQERSSLSSPQPPHLGQPSSALSELRALIFITRRSEGRQRYRLKIIIKNRLFSLRISSGHVYL